MLELRWIFYFYRNVQLLNFACLNGLFLVLVQLSHFTSEETETQFFIACLSHKMFRKNEKYVDIKQFIFANFWSS